MKFFAARFDTVVIRFYVTMFIAIASFMFGFPWAALLCVPTFLSALLAVKFDFGKKEISRPVSLSPNRDRGQRTAA